MRVSGRNGTAACTPDDGSRYSDPVTATSAPTETSHAAALDVADPLASFRDRFVIDDPDVVYLDGNSLGRLPRATIDRLTQVTRGEWGGELIRGWDHWLAYPLEVGGQARAADRRGCRRGHARGLDDSQRVSPRDRGARRPPRPHRHPSPTAELPDRPLRARGYRPRRRRPHDPLAGARPGRRTDPGRRGGRAGRRRGARHAVPCQLPLGGHRGPCRRSPRSRTRRRRGLWDLSHSGR